ncbi:DUF3592 domain-containing protein [Desulfolithobacter sp.]
MAQRMVAPYEVGSRIQVYYNPAHPGQVLFDSRPERRRQGFSCARRDGPGGFLLTGGEGEIRHQ